MNNKTNTGNMSISELAKKHSKDRVMTATTTPKRVRLGSKQIASIVDRMTSEEINNQIKDLTNMGSRIAPMYNLEDLKDNLNLTTEEYNSLHALATKPRVPKQPKAKEEKNNELLSIVDQLATKNSKLKSITDEIEKLTKEKDSLTTEVNNLASKLKVK